MLMPSILGSCVSPEDMISKMPMKFTTQIYDNGLKQFQLSLEKPMGAPLKGGPGGGMSHRGSMTGGDVSMKGGSMIKPQDKMQQRMEKNLIKQLEVKLQETGYCREGYLLTREFSALSLDDLFIKGECVEGASGEDRVMFPNVANIGHTAQ